MAEISATLPRWRRRLALTLVVFSMLLATIAVVGGWMRLVALQSEAWANLSGETLKDPEVRSALSKTLVDRLFETADVHDRIDGQLPPKLSILSGPLTSVAQDTAVKTTDRVLASPKFQEVWQKANLDAHRELMALINGRSKYVDESNGKVELDLIPILELVADKVGVGQRVIKHLPANKTKIDLGLEDELEQTRTVIRTIKAAVVGMVVLSVLMLAGAFWAGVGIRMRVLRWTATASVVAGVILLALQSVGSVVVSRHLAKTPEAELAVSDIWYIFTHALITAGTVLIVIGLGVNLILWILRIPTSAAEGSWQRRTLAFVARYAEAHHVAIHAIWALPLLVMTFWFPHTLIDNPLISLCTFGVLLATLIAARRQGKLLDATS